MYTGELNYDGNQYRFVIEDNILTLISLDFKGLSMFSKGIITPEKLQIKEDYFVGICFSNNCEIVIIPTSKSFGIKNTTLTIQIDYIFEFSGKIKPISGIAFSGNEIDYIYPISKGIDTSYLENDGSVSVKLKNFEETTIDDGCFNYNDKCISCGFSINRSLKMGNEHAPIILNSVFRLYFEETNDYEFILDLINYVYAFFYYLCYRKNIDLSSIEFKEKIGDKYRTCAKLVSFNQKYSSVDSKIKRRCIPYESIVNKAHKILQDIVDGKLYLSHLPNAHNLSFNPASFLMLTAAFEAEFTRHYPDGIKKSQKRIEAQKSATENLDSLISSSKGKEKNIYKYLKQRINDDAAKNKIKLVLDEESDILGPFSNYLYSLNSIEYIPIDVADRLSRQRNAFAHGDLSKPFIDNSLLDIIFMQYVIYAMQLSHYDLSDIVIQRILINLFAVNIKLELKEGD